MAEIDSIQHELIRIKRRCRVFWIILCGGPLLAVLLVPISQGAAKAVGLMWAILSIATWMSQKLSSGALSVRVDTESMRELRAHS